MGLPCSVRCASWACRATRLAFAARSPRWPLVGAAPRRSRRPEPGRAAIPGRAPTSAPTSATSGAPPPTIRRSRPASRAACRPATTCSSGPVGVRRRDRHSAFRRRRPLRAVEILQSLVRHAARPRRLRAQQHPVLRHRRPRLWHAARAEHRHRPLAEHHRHRLGDRRRHGGGAAAQLDGEGGISLRRSQRPLLLALPAPATAWNRTCCGSA